MEAPRSRLHLHDRHRPRCRSWSRAPAPRDSSPWATTRPGPTTSGGRQRPRPRAPTSSSSVPPPCSATCGWSRRPSAPTGIEVDYRDAADDPLVTAGDPDLSPATRSRQPAHRTGRKCRLTGRALRRVPQRTDSVPFLVYDSSAVRVRGHRLHNGQSLTGVVMSDFDHLAVRSGSPADVQVLAHSPSRSPWPTRIWAAGLAPAIRHDLLHRSPERERGHRHRYRQLDLFAVPVRPGLTTCQSAVVRTITTNILYSWGRVRGPSRACRRTGRHCSRSGASRPIDSSS